MSASSSHLPNGMQVPHRHPALPGRSLVGIPYIRKHFYAPEVLPLVGVITFALGMGVYFSTGAARKNDVQWLPRTQPWLQTATNSLHWDGADGVREMLLSGGKNDSAPMKEETH